MSKRWVFAFGALLLTVASLAGADQLEKGDLEVAFRFSFSDLDFDEGGGGSESKLFAASFGYMLTDHHELGAGVGYSGVGSSDAIEYGGAYTYNFRAGESLNPYLAAFLLGFGGDLGDVFDYGYAAELGVKVYPGEHGGMLFGVAYRQLAGAGGAPDATHLLVFGGLTLKF